MDYEKKYKEALAHAREIHRNEEEKRRDMEWLFPELKESDERIRKVLIDYFKEQEECAIKTFFGIPIDDILAWLKKQGEKPQRMISAEAKEALYGKPALSDFENTLADICRGWIGEEIGWGDYISTNAASLLKIAFKKWNDEQCVKKPTEWSEEDRERLAHILRLLDVKDETKYLLTYGLGSLQELKKDIDWLKSLKQRIGG